MCLDKDLYAILSSKTIDIKPSRVFKALIGGLNRIKQRFRSNIDSSQTNNSTSPSIAHVHSCVILKLSYTIVQKQTTMFVLVNTNSIVLLLIPLIVLVSPTSFYTQSSIINRRRNSKYAKTLNPIIFLSSI